MKVVKKAKGKGKKIKRKKVIIDPNGEQTEEKLDLKQLREDLKRQKKQPKEEIKKEEIDYELKTPKNTKKEIKKEKVKKEENKNDEVKKQEVKKPEIKKQGRRFYVDIFSVQDRGQWINVFHIIFRPF